MHHLYLNGNYYFAKANHYLREKKRFIWVVTAILFLINWNIAAPFFKMGNAYFSSNPGSINEFKNALKPGFTITKIMSKETLFLFQLFYIFVSIIAFRGVGLYLHTFFILKKVWSHDEVKMDQVLVPRFPYDQDKLQLVIGLKHKEDNEDLVEKPDWVVVPEKGLFQDFLIIGGKGTGKTAGCMYPFTKQMLYYKAYDLENKAGMLILDVKGNYTKQALGYANEVNRGKDVIVMNLSGKYRYNPLHKPSLKTQVIANRLRTILELFSTQHADSYWLDKAEVLLNESIKLARLFNKGYVTFVEIHKIVNNDEYLNEKIEMLQELEDRNKLTREQKADFRTVKDYFLNEYKTLDTKISSVIKSEVTRMTYTFVSDPQILNVFCAPEDKLNFFGFDDLVDTGKVVVLDMNIAEFRNLSKIVAAYLKLDFQNAAMIRLTRPNSNKTRPLIFISDEYQEYVTASDADFYAVSREAKCINIVSSQSYSSLLKTIKSEEALQTILTNLTNKIWLRTDDKKTAEAAVAQCGVVDKEDVTKGFSESTKPITNYMMGRFGKDNTQITENLNVSFKTIDKFKVTTFTIKLPIFKGIAYLSDGDKIMSPTYVHLQKYFEDPILGLKGRPAPDSIDEPRVVMSEQPAASQSDEFTLEDNFDFDSNRVIDFDEPSADDEKFEDKVDTFDDDFGFDAFADAPRPKKAKEEKKDEFVPKYLDKEVEENLKDIEGIFDED